MIKKKPSYDLETAKRLIQSENTRKISLNALRGADEIGYSENELVIFFLTLERWDFLKSETQHTNHKIWQDYYSKNDGCLNVFVKFKILNDNCILILTSFKEDTSKAPRGGGHGN